MRDRVNERQTYIQAVESQTDRQADIHRQTDIHKGRQTATLTTRDRADSLQSDTDSCR